MANSKKTDGREHVIPPNHLKQVSTLLEKSLNLLNGGTDILPYQLWRDNISAILDDIREIQED